MILMRDAAVRPAYAVVKRCMDVVVASLVLAAGMPLWLTLCLLVKLHDKGPVFFVQERAGLHGRPFRMYKFRSMVKDAERQLKDLVDLDALDEPVFKIRNDPRVTPVGRILRRTSLDEIPQLINVLKGEMSLVGPRPEEMSVVDLYTPWQRRRLKAVPGITGHQQIHNRGEPSLARRIQFDLIYVKHQSFLLDLYILVKTVKVVLFGKGTTH
jgi:lipopolysaccharide/colanic/teichoic acid biosynthesis glycosyltransferase